MNEKWRGSCRQEDFEHWSEDKQRCRWTRQLYADDAKNSGLTKCNGDEFQCPSPFRCIPRYSLNTKQGCYYDNPVRIIIPCRKNEFTCKGTRRCLPRSAVSDGTKDCDDLQMEDGSDETSGRYENCEDDEFRCVASGRCIPREWVNDGQDDCPAENGEPHGHDEMEPLPFCREGMEFRCPDNGRCLLRYRVKDNYRDCKDGSDEITPLTNCTRFEFRCIASGRCIPRSWVLDGKINCPDGSDEVPMANVSCLEGEFLCHDGKRCLPELYLCDGIQHCEDCTDEIEGCETPKSWRCPGDESICFPQSYACDGFSFCPNHTDTMSFLPGFKCKSWEADLVDVTCAIPQWMLNDSISVCLDKSDLCFSENSTCSSCSDRETIIADHQLCDGVADCIDLYDECLCPKVPKNNYTEILCQSICIKNDEVPCQYCQKGEIFCQEDNKCISRKRLCDRVSDCTLSRLDEKFCSKLQAMSNDAVSTAKNYNCLQPSETLIDLLRLFKVYDFLKPYMPDKAVKCDGVLECAGFDDECNSECQEKPTYCATIPTYTVDLKTHSEESELLLTVRTCQSFNPRNIFDNLDYLVGGFICNGIKDCPDGEDEANCTGRYECKAGKTQLVTGEKEVVSIKSTQQCDLTVDCIDDQSDEKECSNETHFYCYEGQPPFVPFADKMNGIQDCEDNSDECPRSAFENNTISSREEMIRIPFLRYFIWIMAFFAIFGNFAVFTETMVFEKHSTLSSMSKCNRTLILNLAASDFIMGVALLLIGSRSASLSGVYCQEDDKWRISGLCNAIGVFVALSSETSVATLVILTSYRLYGVYKPFASRHMKLRNVWIFISSAWLFSILVAVLPVLPKIRDSAVTKALIVRSRYFSSTRISWEEIERFSSRAIVLGNITGLDPDNLGGWDGVAKLREVPSLENYAPTIRGYFGYYSTNGVCISRFFRANDTPPLHPLSVFVVVANFCSLLFIIFSYVMIYKVSSKKAANLQKSGSRDDQNAAMQRKVTILIATDVCCWLPICIMSVMSQADVSIPVDAYAVAAIILLPINSSLNPLIYSNGFGHIRGYLHEKITGAKK